MDERTVGEPEEVKLKRRKRLRDLNVKNTYILFCPQTFTLYKSATL